MTEQTVELQASFAPEPNAARMARAFICEHVPDVIRADAELLANELVTNAIHHARTTLTVRVRANGTRVRVEVADSCMIVPVVVEPARNAERGRGLWLVERLTDRWGVEPTDDGKTVWFEMVCR